MSRILTGITPTGSIHIGNYFGAIKPLIDLVNSAEEDDEVMAFVADLHGLNQVQNPEAMRENTRGIVSAYLAAGLDPQKVTIWRQSDVPAHSELALMLSSITPLGLLERSHAYKDAIANGKNVSLGLFAYPVLMAADILLYEPDLVPVGKDQQQHLEYMADLAGKFNHLFGQTFKIAKGLVSQETGLLPGLDGRKMSKSYGNTIGLFDTAETVTKKIMKITTDSAGPTDPKDPEKDTIFALHRIFSTDSIDDLAERYQSGAVTYKESKELLAANVNALLDPIRLRKNELDARTEYLDEVLAAGAEKAGKIATVTLTRAKHAVGF